MLRCADQRRSCDPATRCNAARTGRFHRARAAVTGRWPTVELVNPRNMPMRRIALACLVLIAAGAPAMDLSSLPADTQWFLHLDLKTAMGGELGELVREVLGTADAKAKLGALTMITGFDPLKDLQSLTVAGSGAGEQAA